MYMDGRYTPEINTRYSKPSANFSSYAYSGKIMLVAVIALFLCCLLFAFFHFYSRWFLLRHSRNSGRRRSSFSVDSLPSYATAQPLHPSVLNSLPTFIYSGKDGCTLECAVCLSEFEYNETGRILPKCNHGFHLDCIDMWFLSHSSCPICRAPVNELGHDPEELVIDVVGSDPISSGLRPNYRCDRLGYSLSSSSLPQLLNSVVRPVRVEVAPVAPRAGIGSDPLIGSKQIAGRVKTLTRYLSI